MKIGENVVKIEVNTIKIIERITTEVDTKSTVASMIKQ